MTTGRAINQNLPPWIPVETEKPRRKPGPKAAPKPAEPPPLHVRIEVAGAAEFILEGDQAAEMRKLLSGGARSEEVLDAFDPWASGIKLNTEIGVAEPPLNPSGKFWAWHVSEFGHSVTGGQISPVSNPFKYQTGKRWPTGITWSQVR
jgi:hypothetical protein